MPVGFAFSDLRDLFAKANEEKSGDQLAGLAASSEGERVAAKRKLADLPLITVLQQPLIGPDEDDVSRLIGDSFDEHAFQPIRSFTVGEFREFLLDDQTSEADLKNLKWAITPEMAAAVVLLLCAAFIAWNETLANWQALWFAATLVALAVSLVRARSAPG